MKPLARSPNLRRILDFDALYSLKMRHKRLSRGLAAQSDVRRAVFPRYLILGVGMAIESGTAQGHDGKLMRGEALRPENKVAATVTGL